MLLIGIRLEWSYVVLILLCSTNSGIAPAIGPVSGKSEVALGNLNVTLKDAYDHVLRFFRPMTCRYKDEQILIPCRVGEGLNTTECLENECCPSEISYELECYMPFQDNDTQFSGRADNADMNSQGNTSMQLTFRLLGLVAGGFLILGCLPFCCCACLQRSQCINPLRKANKKVRQAVMKKREKNEEIYDPLLN